MAMCLFVPWPQEQVAVQRGCSHLEEIGLFQGTHMHFSPFMQEIFDHSFTCMLTLFCVPVVIFSLLSTDTAIPEDFDDLCVP